MLSPAIAIGPPFGGYAPGGPPPAGDGWLFLSDPADQFLFLDGGDFQFLS